ncbi:MAG: ATP-binding cassette domain-containing protein [Desulfurivibrionaceae bacterium]|nr:ATP-binding cassette domain-containing protein [Desulfurivibrionaceae bacterium]
MSASPADDPAREADRPHLALAMAKVSKSFVQGKRRIKALQEVTLEAHKGEVTGLVGPDGAGKTTLMRLAACLLKADSGQIRTLDLDANRQPLKVHAAIGYMPQRFGLYEDLSVQENLDLYADLQGIPLDQRARRYRQLMKMTQLGRFTSRLAGQLSGGMKQKLGLACTLIRSPELLILDEPTVGVDPVSRRELWAIVSRLVAEEGMSVLLSTAYLEEAERCDDVVLLHEGRVLYHGPPADFLSQQEGRTYWLKTEQGQGKRAAQEKLARGDGVVDAVIQGDGVRLVMAAPEKPHIASLLGPGREDAVQPVAPRFEDNYIALLKEEKPAPRLAQEPDLGRRGPGQDSQGKGADSVIQVDHVKRLFGDFYAVKDVSFEVKRGEVFGLLGANGAGKTTTFRMLCGLLPVSEGTLEVAGLDLRKAAAQARGRIGYMSQKFSLYGSLSVLENLQFFSSAYGLRGKYRSQRIEWALEQFDLAARQKGASGEMPLGYKQRLALACALMHEPEILFLDEPTSGVDPMARREFWAHISGLASSGVTVLVTTHFMAEAEYCDRLAIMMAGEILAMGTPLEIKEQAAETGKRAIDDIEEAFIALIEGQAEEAGS